MAISYSIDKGINPSLEQREEISRLSNKYFNFDSDPEQMQVNPKVRNWFMEKFEYGMNLITDGKKIVGFSLVFLSDETTMKKFISKKINEDELSKYFMKNYGKKKLDCLYMCTALVIPEYQHRGIATKAILNQIKKIRKDSKMKCLFYWGYSKEGAKLAEKISRTLKMPLYSRKV